MKTIIEMAREAGFLTIGVQEFVFAPSSFHFTEEIKALVELVRDAEREAILELVDSYAKNNTDLADAIRARGNT